ncbi:hypothetical protein CC86DRAFT_470996 [Ophiobolus disseminans]|uniref:Uncharacterized protein n=1 Tax=Ophiobolus disseminans TaxID=1469910 RepID=A0A6A6ZJH9_9PLEO|nr:hypothetical protein CC86DRAFT_470996 [Ophiobolus disseminans]
MPVIKREESPEPSINSLAPPVPPPESSRTSKAGRWFQSDDAEDVKPPMPQTPPVSTLRLATKQVHRSSKSGAVYRDAGYQSVLDEETVIVPRTQLGDLQYHVQLLQNANTTSEEKVREQERVIRELVSFNHRMHSSMADLHRRLSLVESAQTFNHKFPEPVRATGYDAVEGRRSRSPSPVAQNYRNRETPLSIGKVRGRKQLQIEVPGKMYQPAGTGLQTPATSLMSKFPSRTPNLPLTPGRFGPPPSARKTSTFITKRGIHNLGNMVPPTYSRIPLVPLTDSEVIVFFFNALARPNVSLRLYARGWGPQQICEVLNSHREIEPPYLRNTCSVKCTTAIKKGREKYGEQWEAETRKIFEDKVVCRDEKATDMICLDPDELHRSVDFEILDMCKGLKKFPGKDDGGIFTRCVQYCQENDAPYKVSNVWELASDLAAGITPKRIVSDSSTSSGGFSEALASALKASNHGEEDMEDDEEEEGGTGSQEGDEFSGDDSVMGGAEEAETQESD